MGTRPVVSARLRVVVAVLVALSLSALPLPVGIAATPVQAAAPVGKPNLFDPRTQAGSVKRAAPSPPVPSGPAPAYHPLRRNAAVPMAPLRVDLEPGRTTSVVGSDGVLEVDVPAGSVSAADGTLSLVVRQVLPASGSSAGGWGLYSFGTWLMQVVDGRGGLARVGLRHPMEVKLHVAGRARALDLAHTVAVLNPSLPSWVDLSPTPSLGAPSRQRTTLDAAGGALTASVSMLGPSTAVSFDTTAPQATFGKPDPFETNLSGGGLTASFPLDVPSGPGGLTPPLTLAYNSAGVSDQHNPAGAAPWVGEGWNLTLGSISWAQRNLHTVNPNNPPLWEDSWELSDAFGTAAQLIPPNVNVKTYVDDTTNPITPSPVSWHTAPETRDRVISFTNPTPGFNPSPPCFRVFKPSGIMEEFGCTPDSLQWYPQPSGSNTGLFYVSGWLLDLITDPAGNQIHVTYQVDTATGVNGIRYPRDAQMATVEYDSPGCLSAQAACTGSTWQPLMRVSFQAAHTVVRGGGTGCNAGGRPRCDAPGDLSSSGGLAAPLIESTFVLNDVLVQTRTGGSAAWNTLRDYQLSYDQSPSGSITDPVSGLPQSAAGTLALTRLQEIGADGSTALPARVFGYTTVIEYYEDSLGLPTPRSNCGPSWNNGQTPNGAAPGCILWSRSYGGNSFYLNAVSNG